jgi:outer membrane cobalamin receptor
MRNNFFFILSLLCSTNLYANKYTLHGTIRDSLTGETLIGASIYIVETKQGTISNAYGFYSINQPEGIYTVIYSYVGYNPVKLNISLHKEIYQDVKLINTTQELKEVVITSSKTNVQTVGTSRNELPISRIKSIPTATGEPDVLKSLQLLPGIQAANEGASNLYVRGGSYDQNLILLDEAPVYNPVHALSFFSTFNADAIKNVLVYKGAFPVQYGGRLSSVVDIAMREGNYNKTQINGGIGLIASHLTIEGPVIKEKASYIISCRYSYAGQTLNLLAGKIGSDILNLYALRNFSDKNKIWFYDLNAKINFKINDKNHIYLSTYTGHDNFYCFALNNNNELNWGNVTSTLRWNHIFSGKLFSNYTLYYSNYNYQYSIREDIRNFIWESKIKETGIKADFTYYLNEKNMVKSGISIIHHYFAPGSISPADTTSIIGPFSLDKKKSAEIATYIGNEQTLISWLTLNYGLRYTVFLNIGPGTVYSYNTAMNMVTDSTIYKSGRLINSYNGLEPRVSARLKINNNNAIKIAYAFTSQYLHLLSNSTVGLPTDTWLPPDKYVKPQTSNQFILGYYRTFSENIYEFSVETYYKTLDNIIDYKDNADLFLNKHIETQLLKGKGYSYGMEFLLEKKVGKLTGWIGYTYAQTQYKIDGINKNRYYSPRYDIRHNLSLTGNYDFSKAWSVSSTFKLASGGFITIPDQIFTIDGAAFFDYSSRNNYKLPVYHRLDFSALYKSPKNESRRYKSQWVFSVYNVYNRKNIYSLFIKQRSDDFTSASAYKMYLFGIMPSITYNLSF